MLGVIMWYNKSTQAGMVWCEDGSEYASISSFTKGLDVIESLRSGDMITFKEKWLCGSRFVMQITSFTRRIKQNSVACPELFLPNAANMNIHPALEG